MKIRNKKTGEVFEAFRKAPIDLYFYLNKYEEGENDFDRKTYQSLAELNDEWEDYKPKEPLIKDEKIRKAIRAWAEANDMSSDSVVICGSFDDGFETDTSSIEFDCTIRDALRGLKRGKSYTIDELCGEEEE